jgi:hypothetical protein
MTRFRTVLKFHNSHARRACHAWPSKKTINIQLVIGALALCVALLGRSPAAEAAKSPVTCAGAVMMGGAQLMCSHTDSEAPPQICTFSWDLQLMDMTTKVVEGSFLITPGVTNMQIYQGGGFNQQVTGPIVMCQAKKSQ